VWTPSPSSCSIETLTPLSSTAQASPPAPPTEAPLVVLQAVPADAHEIVSLGVSAGFLRDFQASLTDPDITTERLCEAVIKPATLDRCAFLDTLRGRTDSSGKPSVGRATVFVSHAWRYHVNDVIDTMLDYASANPDVDQYFWFDIFVNNQHAEGLNHPFEWWCSAFKDNIAAIGTVLLVMTPWDAPIPLTRAWCLWEIYCALELEQQGRGVQLMVRLPANQRAAFLAGVKEGYGNVMKALAAVDAEKA
jgi:hypothetical protein